METRIILIVGSILLCCGCIGLVIVRVTNPFFKGLGWLGGCFAAGAVAAATFAGHPSVLSIVPNTSVLLAFVMLHLCILELTEHHSSFPSLGAGLLVLQAIGYFVFLAMHHAREFGVVTLGILVAAQVLQSVAQLKKSMRNGMRAATWFSIVLLVAFAGFNLFRSTAILVIGTSTDPHVPNPLEVVAAVVFLSTGLGIGFGMFWITSSEIRMKLEALANVDPLTGLSNRRSFLEFCERELLISTRAGRPFSLVLLDVDNFKQINDRYGHEAGDSVLRETVVKLRNGVRNIDVLGRWGGEEFVALLPGADAEAALIVAERLRRSVESMSIASPKARNADEPANIQVTISLGVATYNSGMNDGKKTIEALFRRCDEALYQAKSEGRNRVVQTVY